MNLIQAPIKSRSDLTLIERGLLSYVVQSLDKDGHFQQKDSSTALDVNSTRSTINRLMRQLIYKGFLQVVKASHRGDDGWVVPAVVKPNPLVSTALRSSMVVPETSIVSDSTILPDAVTILPEAPNPPMSKDNPNPPVGKDTEVVGFNGKPNPNGALEPYKVTYTLPNTNIHTYNIIEGGELCVHCTMNPVKADLLRYCSLACRQAFLLSQSVSSASASESFDAPETEKTKCSANKSIQEGTSERLPRPPYKLKEDAWARWRTLAKKELGKIFEAPGYSDVADFERFLSSRCVDLQRHFCGYYDKNPQLCADVANFLVDACPEPVPPNHEAVFEYFYDHELAKALA